jgi:hypothetical protein
MKANSNGLKGKGFTSRIDSVLSKASVKLAGGTSRRTFIGRLTSGIIVLGTTSVALKPSKANAQACTPEQCWGQVDVNVCYSPWEVVAAEEGQDGVVLRKGPSFSADPVTYSTGGNIVIPVGDEFGRCSNRSGSVSGGCPDPGPRLSQDGFIWGYWPGYARQGWMPYSVDGVTYAVGDDSLATLCGPAGYDFDCRYAHSACPMNACGGNPVGTPTCSQTYRPIVPYDTDPSDQRFYLRYAYNSTTFGWCVPGDVIMRYGYISSGGVTWSCVEAYCCQYIPQGCRGWIESSALGSPITQGSGCSPDIACPNS